MPVPFMVRSVSGSFLSIIIRQLKVVFDVLTYETFVISPFSLENLCCCQDSIRAGPRCLHQPKLGLPRLYQVRCGFMLPGFSKHLYCYQHESTRMGIWKLLSWQIWVLLTYCNQIKIGKFREDKNI